MEWLKYIRIAWHYIALFINKTSTIQLKDLKTHPIFSHINNNVYVTIPNLAISCPGREHMFKDLLTLSLLSYKQRFKDLLNADNLLEMSTDELLTSVSNAVGYAIKDYEDQARQRNIPEIVVRRIAYLNRFDIKRIHMISENLCKSQIFDTNYEKLYAIMTNIDAILVIGLVETSNYLNSLNGELDGLVYNGIKCRVLTEQSTGNCDG